MQYRKTETGEIFDEDDVRLQYPDRAFPRVPTAAFAALGFELYIPPEPTPEPTPEP